MSASRIEAELVELVRLCTERISRLEQRDAQTRGFLAGLVAYDKSSPLLQEQERGRVLDEILSRMP